MESWRDPHDSRIMSPSQERTSAQALLVFRAEPAAVVRLFRFNNGMMCRERGLQALCCQALAGRIQEINPR